MVSSPILHDNESEFLTLTLIECLNLSKNDPIGALKGTGVGIFPLGPNNCPNDLPTTGISFVSAKKKSYLFISFLDSLLFCAKLSSSALSST